ncbi:hypothetical protein ACVBEF_19765 [Glaciimonas sp. GG7]
MKKTTLAFVLPGGIYAGTAHASDKATQSLSESLAKAQKEFTCFAYDRSFVFKAVKGVSTPDAEAKLKREGFSMAVCL